MKNLSKEIELTNGSRLLSIHTPNTVSTYFACIVKGGHVNTSKNNCELPHLTEHVISRSGDSNYLDHREYIFDIVRKGTYYSTKTSSYSSTFSFITSEKNLSSVAKIAIAHIGSPALDKKTISEEKRAIIERLKEILKDDNLTSIYNNRGIILSLPNIKERIRSLKTLDMKDILDYHAKHYTAGNTLFLVAGDLNEIQEKELIESINEELKKYPTDNELKLNIPKPEKYKRKIAILERNGALSHFCLSFVNGKDKKDRYIMHIIDILLEDISLFDKKTQIKGLFYSLKTGFSINPEYSKLSIKGSSNPENMYELFEDSLCYIKKIRSGNFTDKTLKDATGRIVEKTKLVHEVPASYAKWYMRNFILGRKLENIDEYIKNIQSISKSDVVDFSKKLINSNSWVLTLVDQDIDKNKYQKVLDKYIK